MIRTILTFLIASFFICFTIVADSERIARLEKNLTESNDTSKVHTLLELATEYEYQDHEKAIEYTLEAKSHAEKLGYATGQIRSLYELAIISFLKGDRESARSYLDRGIDKSLEIKDDQQIASGYYHLSHYYEEEGDFPLALENLNKALLIFQENDQIKRVSQCFSSLGGIYKTLGQYEEALKYYFNALEIKQSINDQRGISIVFSNIGSVYLLTEKYDEASEYFHKAYEIDLSNDDQEGIVYTLTRIGVVNQKTGNYDEAIAYYDTALVLARQLNFRIDESILLGNIGSTLATLHKYAESLSYLFSALELKMELKRIGSAAHTCNDICETYLYMDNPLEAKKYALQAIELSTDVDINQGRYGWLLLAECDYELGSYRSAYEHLLKANTLKDSIFSIESEARMHEMEVKYQTEIKESEIQNLIKEKEAVEFRRNTYIIAGLSSIVFLLVLYNSQRLKSRKNRQLLEKEKELDRMKSRFFANISHEFRTPLTLILGPIDEMMANNGSPVFNKNLKVMKRNAGRLLNLVNQLLDLSKIESGKFKLKISKSDIISVVKGVAMSYHSMAEQRNIELTLDISPELLEMNYDREKLETVLTNLLSNAFKFTPDHGIISITANIELHGRSEVFRIIVTDSGRGIPEKDIDQIFNRFYQSDSNEFMQQEGSGIGLALSKELVELHGGRIYATSQRGEGTQVVFEIPTDIPDSHIISQKSSIARPIEATGFDELDGLEELELENEIDHIDARPIVLIVEDHPDVQNYLRDILKNNYSIHVANNGLEGIEKAIEIIPDLIVSDVMMPIKNGYEVCRSIKTDEKTSHIPVILLTAKSDSEDKIEGLQALADDYITKPFLPKELTARIHNLINTRQELRKKYKKEGVLKPKDIASNTVDEQFLERLIEIVELNMGDEKFGVELLGDEMGMSRSQLHRKLKALLDQGPNQFIRSFRLQRAHELLIQHAATASEIAYQVGFGSPSYFTKCFHEEYGYTPTEIPA